MPDPPPSDFRFLRRLISGWKAAVTGHPYSDKPLEHPAAISCWENNHLGINELVILESPESLTNYPIFLLLLWFFCRRVGVSCFFSFSFSFSLFLGFPHWAGSCFDESSILSHPTFWVGFQSFANARL